MVLILIHLVFVQVTTIVKIRFFLVVMTSIVECVPVTVMMIVGNVTWVGVFVVLRNRKRMNPIANGGMAADRSIFLQGEALGVCLVPILVEMMMIVIRILVAGLVAVAGVFFCVVVGVVVAVGSPWRRALGVAVVARRCRPDHSRCPTVLLQWAGTHQRRAVTP